MCIGEGTKPTHSHLLLSVTHKLLTLHPLKSNISKTSSATSRQIFFLCWHKGFSYNSRWNQCAISYRHEGKIARIATICFSIDTRQMINAKKTQIPPYTSKFTSHNLLFMLDFPPKFYLNLSIFTCWILLQYLTCDT